MRIHPVTPCLWFDHQAEEAARFYVEIFSEARLGRITRFGEEGKEIHRRTPGSRAAYEGEEGSG